MNILLIDDDPCFLECISYEIDRLSIKTNIYKKRSVPDALNFLTSQECPPIDSIFLDERMPSCNGSDALPLLKAYPACQETKYILLTNLAHDELRSKALAIGFDSFLEKPVTKAKLERLLIDKCLYWGIRDLPRDLELYWRLTAQEKIKSGTEVLWR